MAAISSNRKRALTLAVVVAAVVAIVVPTTRWMHTLTTKLDAVTARQDRIEELLTGPAPAGSATSGSSGGRLKSSGTFAYPVGPITGTLGQGTYPAPAPASTIQWGTAVAAPQLTQASESSATKGADMLFTPQQSTQATNEGPGNFVVNFEASIGTGVEGAIIEERAGVPNVTIGPLSQASPGFGSISMGSAKTLSMYGDGSSQLSFSAPSGAVMNFTVIGPANPEFVISGSLIQMSQPVGGNVGGGVPFSWATTAANIACGTGGTQTIAAAQAATPGLNISSGTLTSNCTIDFTTNASKGWFLVNLVNISSLSTFSLIFKNGAATAPLTQTQFTALQTAGKNGVQVWTTTAPSIILL